MIQTTSYSRNYVIFTDQELQQPFKKQISIEEKNKESLKGFLFYFIGEASFSIGNIFAKMLLMRQPNLSNMEMLTLRCLFLTISFLALSVKKPLYYLYYAIEPSVIPFMVLKALISIVAIFCMY